MSCHYSCLTCSGQIYADKCILCPDTRQLIDTTCYCASSYLQYQKQKCLTTDQISRPDATFYMTLQFIYWVMLTFSLIVILGNFNHLYSTKIRVLIGWAQLMSLLLDYRYRFTELSQMALKIFSVWNFRYFNQLICTKRSKPYQCQSYQNLYGPCLTLAAFFFLMIVSFIMTKTCIFSIFTDKSQQTPNEKMGDAIIIKESKQTYQKASKKKQNSIISMSFVDYIKISAEQFIFLYLDYTIIQWSVQLSRIIVKSTYLYYLYIPILILLLWYMLRILKIVNSKNQFRIEYRSQQGYFYFYDQRYYLGYLDYLFEEEQKKKKNKLYKPNRYFPHSNYLVLQLFIKFFIATITIIMFQYKPQIWIFPCLIVLIVSFLKLGVFQIHDRLALLCYVLGFLLYLLSVALFFIDYFFNVWVLILVFLSTFAYFILLINDFSNWSREKQGKYWAIAFEYLDGETQKQFLNENSLEKQNVNKPEKNNTIQQHSQDGLISNEVNRPNNLIKPVDQQFSNSNENVFESNTLIKTINSKQSRQNARNLPQSVQQKNFSLMSRINKPMTPEDIKNTKSNW